MLIIDRFEGDMAVIEVSNGITYTIDIPRSELPSRAREGDVIKIVIDGNTTGKRKKDIDKLADELFE